MSIFGKPLFQAEGFDSAEQMDEWFTKLLKKDENINQSLMLLAFATLKDCWLVFILQHIMLILPHGSNEQP